MSNKPRRSPDLPKAAIDVLWQGNLIGAITVVRRERNLGLQEAKGQVEAYIASQPALKKKLDKVWAMAGQASESPGPGRASLCRRREWRR